LRLFSCGGYGLALAALALVVFGAIECPPNGNTMFNTDKENLMFLLVFDSRLHGFGINFQDRSINGLKKRKELTRAILDKAVERSILRIR